MRPPPVVEQSLDAQRPLQSFDRLGIEILATTKSTATATQSCMVRFTVIGVNFTLVTQGRPGMLVLDPLPARTALRPLNFHRHLQAFSPRFANVVHSRELAPLQPNARQLPQLSSVAPFPIGEPAHALARLGPVPHLTDDSLEQG